jgi:hypothetical protein
MADHDGSPLAGQVLEAVNEAMVELHVRYHVAGRGRLAR